MRVLVLMSRLTDYVASRRGICAVSGEGRFGPARESRRGTRSVAEQA